MDDASNPILSSSKANGNVNGIHTDVFCCNYENLVLVIISQYGKLGTMIHVKKETVTDGTETSVYFSSVLLGEDDMLTNVIARNLASHIDSSKAILFNLALKDKSPTAAKEFAKLLSECKCW